MKKHLSLILGVVLIFLVIPGGIFGGFAFFNYLGACGLDINPNFSGGFLLGECIDPEGDLLMTIPESFAKDSIANSLDITGFSIRLVRFPLPSGQGIENRLNLVAGFNGKFSDPADLQNGFSLNAIHFYIDSPFITNNEPVISDKSAHVEFSPFAWDYEVIVDGYHSRARIYDTKGNLAGLSSAVYVRQETEPTPKLDQKKWPVKKTIVIAAIPLKLLGDVKKGEWHYFALTGIADALSPSFLLHPGADQADAFDIAGSAASTDGIPVMQPLIIIDGEMK